MVLGWEAHSGRIIITKGLSDAGDFKWDGHGCSSSHGSDCEFKIETCINTE